ncbi:phasin family protein [Rhodobacter sp. CZR27]|uniref:phasin family protein n=1 Tax=Rhodobacter sp. CZR27 TaxID=2033869 RepID=UPI000BBF0694|nr:phasin family protein [Rhodobacter sp. CZR27]
MTFSKRPDTTGSAPATADLRQTATAFQAGPAVAFDLWNRLTNEMMQFAADRVCETVKTQQQMLQCRNFAELAHLRAHWWQRAIDQYTEEAGRLTGIWTETLDRSFAIRTL